ncbi:MAG: hypothetical protein AVDCRST_MAG22-679 [uncultured Rubrobacteraceae bacterium]|uniref:Uncharacterized protein n=1 Tax=uncultured Rubrobacteraceae bacterium TaxID=349277 RepID=A0A6J4NU51_9ACTN|nr:MAG: hypothetical protein AVDCRST_MAG22-679 [uncultured Rubrobacteraceae bacterium]
MWGIIEKIELTYSLAKSAARGRRGVCPVSPRGRLGFSKTVT